MIVFTVSEDNKAGLAFIIDLYRRYPRLMYTMARRCVPSYQNCRDIVQDAVESLCKTSHADRTVNSCLAGAYYLYCQKTSREFYPIPGGGTKSSKSSRLVCLLTM